MAIEDTIAKLSGFVGQNWDDVADQVDTIVMGDGFVYRWLEPTTQLSPGDRVNRPDRINVNVDANLIVQNYTVG